MNKSFKVRIYPNQKQKILINKTFGCVRYIYNRMLKFKQKAYNIFELKLNYVKISSILTKLKKRKTWICEVDAVALQQCLRDLDAAYIKFFNGAGYPKFKTKRGKNSYRTNGRTIILDQENKMIRIPKVGWIKFRDKTNFSGLTKINNITISKTASGKYFASISAEIDITAFAKTKKNCGIDLGLKDFCILNDGIKFENPRFFVNNQRRLKLLQQSLSRKIKDSKNYLKARARLAKFHEYIANCRKDYLHKISIQLVREYDIICTETLQVKEMLMENDNAKDISDVSWYEFIQQLEYKCLWYNKVLSKIDTFYPSSQLCSNCGYRNYALRGNTSIREWTCPECGEHHDRDINAATNILNQGLTLL